MQNNSNEIIDLFCGISEHIDRYLQEKKTMKWNDYLKIPDIMEIDGEHFPNLNKDINLVISDELKNADIIISCLDNMKIRFHLNLASQILKIPFVNGGATEFMGKVDKFNPNTQDACLICRYGPNIKDDDTVISCTEEGQIPIQSIVTTNAIISSIQSLITILELLNIDIKNNFFDYSGQELELNNFSFERLDKICPGHLSN